MWRDLRYATRGLLNSPLFTLAAVLGLGLAIGANATIFGLVDGLWLRPPAIAASDDVVRVFQTTDTTATGLFSYDEYLTLRDETTAFSDVTAVGQRGALMADRDGLTELLLANVVTLNFFTTLGVRPAHGRLFSPADAQALDAEPAVVLGHAFWRRRFGADPAIVGQTIELGPPLFPVRVLGVLPPSFRDLDPDSDRDLWMPTTTWTAMHGRGELEGRRNRWFDVIARLRPGVSADAAHSEVAGLAQVMAAGFPETNAGRDARVISDFDYRLEVGGLNALALLGLVLIVVIITCVNIANLLLARTIAHTRELAMRVALGAGRGRLARQLLIESGVIGAAGAVTGLLIALWLFRLLPAVLVPPPGFRSFAVFEADGRVVAFTAGVTLLTTLLFGLAPAFAATRADVVVLIKGLSNVTGSARFDRVFRHVLVTGQVAVSVVLVYAAGVLAQSFIQARTTDLGYDGQPILAAWVPFGRVSEPLTDEARRQLDQLPGVVETAVAIRAPLSLSGGGWARPVFVPGVVGDPAEGLPDVKLNAVSANYFRTMGTRLVRGRPFDDAEARDGAAVIVASEAFAARFFPEGDALDALVVLGGVDGVPHRIVGIAEDIVINRIGEDVEPYLYVPYGRDRWGEATLLVKVDGDAAALAPSVRRRLVAIDERLDPRLLTPVADLVRFSAGPYQATASLAGGLGLVGLILTTLGLYGVVAYRAHGRTREIGIRMALGATRQRVLGLVLGDGARVGLAGVAIGIPLALVSGRLLASLLFGVGPWSLPTLATAGVVLLAATGLASLVPALRATGVSPSRALRDS